LPVPIRPYYSRAGIRPTGRCGGEVSVSSIKIEGSAEVGGEKLTDAGSLCKIGGVDNHLEWGECILGGYLVAAMPDEGSWR